MRAFAHEDTHTTEFGNTLSFDRHPCKVAPMRRAVIIVFIAATALSMCDAHDAVAGETAFVWSRFDDGDLRTDADSHVGGSDQSPPNSASMISPGPNCPFADKLSRAATRAGLQPAIAIAVAHAETRCRHNNQRSPKGALGLMQLMPATARRFGASNPLDVDQNIAAGVAYLAWLDTRYDGDLVRTLAAYNAGEGAVDRYNGVPPFRETQAYVAAITRRLNAPSDASAQTADEIVVAEMQPAFVMTFAHNAAIAVQQDR